MTLSKKKKFDLFKLQCKFLSFFQKIKSSYLISLASPKKNRIYIKSEGMVSLLYKMILLLKIKCKTLNL